MLLAVDVGNTNTVFALYNGRELVQQWRISTNRGRTSDEYAVALLQLMQLEGYGPQKIGAVIISSVVPQAIDPLRRMSKDFFGKKAFIVGEDLDFPIRITLNNPKEIGADRLVNAIAACERYTPPLIIVDFGTATTFDVVNHHKAYCGGVIAPGINLSLEALHRAAAKLPRIAVEAPDAVIGRSTVSAMQSGVYWGYIGLIEGLIDRIESEFGQEMTVIATGGLAPLFREKCEKLRHLDPDLTMAGLMILYENNRELIRGSLET